MDCAPRSLILGQKTENSTLLQLLRYVDAKLSDDATAEVWRFSWRAITLKSLP